MGNLFDPNNPKTWPQNYKAPTTAAFTNKGVPARDLAEDKVKNRFGGLTPKKRDPYYESGKKLFDTGVMEPVRSMGRTVTGKNAAIYANPSNGANWKQRLGAAGEDLLNVASFIPGVAAGAQTLKKGGAPVLKLGAKELITPTLYDYGLHTNKYPNISGTIDSSRFLNMGGAGDAIPGHSYQWGMSPKTGAYSNAEMQERATDLAMIWTDRLADRTMMEDDEMLSSLTQYFTRGPANKAIPDPNLSTEGYARLENPATAINAPLEILGKVPYNLDPKAYKEAIKNMIESRQREIALNNKRLKYQKGLNNYTPPPPRYEFAPGELQP